MPSLRVVVLRFDDKMITEMTMDQFMPRLIQKFLEISPDFRRKLFTSKDKMDAELAAALNQAWINLRTDMFSVGFKPSTWMNE